MAEQLVFLEQRQQFLTHLQNVIGIAESNQAEVVIVGGIALRAAMGKDVEFRRSNGTIPDYDLVGLGPNPDVLKKTNSEIANYRKSNPSCPPVGLEPVIFSHQPRTNFSILEVLSGDRRDNNGEFYLTFRSVDQPIDRRVMNIYHRNYGGVEIPTLSQETILHRYKTRMGGYLKPKDFLKVEEFRQFIENNGGDHLDPNLFLSYVEFCRKVHEAHPVVIKISQTFWKLDQKIGGKISGSSSLFYNLIDYFHR